MRGDEMEILCFVLWMIGYPFASSITGYLAFLSGRTYSYNVRVISALLNISIWFYVGSLIWSKV